MSHYFLPVNPCCTNVVNPCGCSSTTSNTGPCNTILTASSTIAYDGLALSCTTIEPSDTLNVVLQKIDEVMCNLLGQINTLTAEVDTLNSQITTINGDIIDINNRLDVCCPNVTTTSTSSTTSTTTTIFCDSWYYNVTAFSCDCIEGSNSTQSNGEELNIGSFYYSSNFGSKIRVNGIDFPCDNSGEPINVQSGSEANTCAGVICPTTTTTTTAL